MEMDDLEDIILDEIALEGLSGVNLERLWTLLEQRQTPFPLQCDDQTKNFIWQDLLCQHQSISFYIVPEEFQQQPNGNVVEEKTPTKKKKKSKIILQANEAMIDDPITKDRGFCLYYKQRTDVTAEIRKEAGSDCLSLQEVTSKWGNSLVLVASQEARLRALISQVTTADVPLEQPVYYCCLEYVAQCRYQGASQASLSTLFDVGFSYVFHMCKILMKHGVVFKETSGNLKHIYLVRFRPQSQITRKIKCAEKILDYLTNQPNKMAPRYELVEHALQSEDEEVTYGQFKKSLRGLKSNKLVEAVGMTAKDLPQFSRPDVLQSLAEHLEKIKDKEGDNANSANKGRKPEDFTVICIRLLEQNRIANIDVEDNDDEEDADLDLKSHNPTKELDFTRLCSGLMLTDAQLVYSYVEKNQNKMNGVSINEVMHAFVMDRYRVRLVFRRFFKLKIMKSFTFVNGKIRESRFFTQRSLDEGAVPENIMQLHHEEEKKQSKDDITAAYQPSPQAGGSSDHLESLQGGDLQPTIKSEDKGSGGKIKGVSQAWKTHERARLILEHVAQVRVIEGHLLHKYIKKIEAEMGSKTECCRKSMFRILNNLSKEGKLNYFTKEIRRKCRAKKETIKIVTEKSIGDNDPQVQSLLDRVIVKPTFPPQTSKMPVLYRKLKLREKKKSIGISDLLKLKMQHTHEKRKVMEKYGYKGKMERLDALHKFLWYLLYEEKKEDNEVKLEPLEQLPPGAKDVQLEPKGAKPDIVVAKTLISMTPSGKKTTSMEQSPEENEESAEREEPKTHIECYLDTKDPADWRRYVPPGRGHEGRLKGWAAMNDILTYLPLSLYVQLNSVLQMVPGLDEMLAHPRMRHYPISVLGLQLFHSRDVKRAVSNLHVSLEALSGMGLIYFDRDQRNQFRNQVNFYLCRSGFFLDTTSSSGGYDQVEDKEYPRRTYTFSSLDDVTQFWLDFKMTCFSTPLGVIKMQPSTRPKKENTSLIMVADSIHETPPDPVNIPGDHRGAGGLDTSFYAHRSGNWDTIRCRKVVSKNKPSAKVKKDQTENEGRETDKCELKKIRVSVKEHKKATAGGKGQKRKTSKSKSKPEKGKADEEGTSGPGPSDSDLVQDVTVVTGSRAEIILQKAKKDKKVKPKSKSKTHLSRNRHIYDKEDLLASQRKVLRRVKWSAREDNLLLLCGLSLRILKAKCAKGEMAKRFVAWSVVRDILQENLEESSDKTSAAAARRYRTLLKDPTNLSNFSVCLTDIHSDKEIKREFMSRKADYEDEKVREKEFRELCMILAKKFESHEKSEMLALPSSIEGLYEKFDIMNSNLPVATTMEEFELKDVKSEEEITFSILFKIVLISMLSHHFRRHDMKEIYFALRQYDSGMLKKAVDRFKSHGFMGRNRNGMMDVVNTQRAMHMVPMSFQFTKTFFNLFRASSIPNKIIEETRTILSEILAECKKASDEVSLEGDEMTSICIDDMKGNKSSIICVPALEMACDTVHIPKDIISLDLSASEKVRLQKKHEEEMMREVEDGDLEEEEVEDDDDLSEKPREAKRKASEMSEDVAPTKIRRALAGTVGRSKVAFVRTAHKEWRQTLADKPAEEPEKMKGSMSSLIPRLLKNMEKQKTDDACSKAIEPSNEPGIVDSTAKARQSLALDHDYFTHEPDRTPETSQDSSVASCQQASDEATAPSPNTVQVDNVSSPSKAQSVEEVASDQGKTPTSFFTWLTMRGLLTQEYSKKPQNIHEDITVSRCSIHLKPKPCLLNILDKYHISSKQEPRAEDLLDEKDITLRPFGSELSNARSEDQFLNTNEQRSEEKTSSLLQNSESIGRTMNTNVPGHVESLGELIYDPCGPIQTFRRPTLDSNLRPTVEYTIKEPCRSLEDICIGHKHRELLGTIYQVVKSGGSLGLTYPQLLDLVRPSRHQTRSMVFNCLRILLREQLVLEVGTTVVRVVDRKCASVWLLKSVRSIAVSATTPPENSGLIHPAKKAKVSEQSISQTGMNGEHAVRDDELEIRRDGEALQEGSTLPPNRIDLPARGDTHDSLHESSIDDGGEAMMEEGDKGVSEKDGSDIAEAMNADEDVSSMTSDDRGKKRKKADRKGTVPLEVRYEPVTILSHPWTNIDGSVNYQSLAMFVSSFALLIISKPGMKESDLFSHFQNVMAPVECLHIIKFLVNADIITRHSSYVSVKVKLFGPPLNTKPTPTFFYQPTVAALMNLALLKNNITQSEEPEI